MGPGQLDLSCILVFALLSPDHKPSLSHTINPSKYYSHVNVLKPRMISVGNFVKNRHIIVFTELAPLGPFSHRVAMSVCVSVPSGTVFKRPLIGPEIA